jgi:pimeloyl-ACP methyl ester carboxylesterase
MVSRICQTNHAGADLPATNPALLLLPGLLNDHRLWARQVEALAGDADIAIPDLSRLDTVAALAEHALAEAPAASFVLAGLSMGGYVALEIMRMAPQRVRGLVLMDTSARPDTPEQLQRRRDLVRLAGMGKFMGVTPRLMPSLVARASLARPEVTEPIMKMAIEMGRDVYIRQQTAIMGRIDSRPYLPLITCPTLVVVGLEDFLTPPEIARETAGLIPGAELRQIRDAGHLPPLEQADEVSRLLKLFLKRAHDT